MGWAKYIQCADFLSAGVLFPLAAILLIRLFVLREKVAARAPHILYRHAIVTVAFCQCFAGLETTPGSGSTGLRLENWGGVAVVTASNNARLVECESEPETTNLVGCIQTLGFVSACFQCVFYFSGMVKSSPRRGLPEGVRCSLREEARFSPLCWQGCHSRYTKYMHAGFLSLSMASCTYRVGFTKLRVC